MKTPSSGEQQRTKRKKTDPAPQQPGVFDVPRFRNHWQRSDPETSRLAAQSITPAKLSEVQGLVLDALEKGPATDEQILERVRRTSARRASPQSLRSRRCELVRHGLVVDSGRRGRTEYGSSAIVWEIKP